MTASVVTVYGSIHGGAVNNFLNTETTMFVGAVGTKVVTDATIDPHVLGAIWANKHMLTISAG